MSAEYAEKKTGHAHRVFCEPCHPRDPAYLRRLEGLALHHPLERLSHDEELAVNQIPCHALLGRAYRRQLSG